MASILLAGALAVLAVVAAPPRLAGATPVALDEEIGAVAEAIAKRIDGHELTVAVPDVPTLEGRTTVLGRYVAEELVTALHQRGIPVVERSLLDRAMSELELGLTDLMSVAAVKRFGRLVGARAIVIGTLTDLDQSVKLNLRIVAVETGQVVGAASGSLPRDPQTTGMLAQDVSPRRVPARTPNGGTIAGGDALGEEAGWSEDFSQYEDGDPLPAWGPNIVVRKYPNGRSYLGSLVPGIQAVRQAVLFPPNFSFEFDLTMDRVRWIEFALIMVDEKGDELRVDCVHNRQDDNFTVTLPGVNPQTVEAGDLATLKLVKAGTTFKAYVSGRFVTTGVYSGYGRFTGFKLSVPPGVLFTGFVGIRLP